MPLLGTGYIPSGAIGSELTAVTRRAFVPSLIVQLYNNSPLMASLLANAQMASGGVSSVTVPVQGAQFVNGQWTDYSGSFSQPSVQQGAYETDFNLKLMVVPIPYLGMEGLVQDGHAIIRLAEARMNDASNVMRDVMSTALFTNTSNALQFIGLPGAIDDGTNLATYGNINRLTNTWWKAKYTNRAAANPTRLLVVRDIVSIAKNCGEMPTFGICGPGTWAKLSEDYIGVENFRVTPNNESFDQVPGGARSAFQALMVAGVPIYFDPYCTEGAIFYINTNYMNLYIHEQASFSFSGFYSTIPNFQIGAVGVLVTVAELVCAKPKAQGQFFNYGSATV